MNPIFVPYQSPKQSFVGEPPKLDGGVVGAGCQKLPVGGEGGEADGATEGKFVSFCAIADLPKPNCSIPTGGEEALTVRGKGDGGDEDFVGFPSSDEA